MNASATQWYRMPIVWLVIALPAATVPAGLATLALALQGADPVIRESRTDGIAINQDPARDSAAKALDVRATIRIESQRVTAQLSEGHGVLPERLVLVLSHATVATEDRELRLNRVGPRSYAAPLDTLPSGHWYLELAPSDRAWRLTGEFKGASVALDLQPRAKP